MVCFGRKPSALITAFKDSPSRTSSSYNLCDEKATNAAENMPMSSASTQTQPEEKSKWRSDWTWHRIGVVVNGFIMVAQCTGVWQAFGLFLAFHTEHIGLPDAVLSADEAKQRDVIALLAILGGAGARYLFGGIFTALLPRIGTIRWLAVASTILGSAGLVGVAFSSNLLQMGWSFFFYGLGGSMMYMPMLATYQAHFDSRTATTGMGIINTGMGAGGLLYAYLIGLLLKTSHYRITLLILAAMNFGSLLLVSITAPELKETKQKNMLPRKSTLNTTRFYLSAFAAFANNLGYWLPIAFGPVYSGATFTDKSHILALLLAISALARIPMGMLANRGRTNIVIGITSCVSALAVFTLWLPSTLSDSIRTSQILWWTFNALYGLTAAGHMTLFQQSIMEAFEPDEFFAVMGVINIFRGVAIFVGAVSGGYIIGMLEAVPPRSKFVGLALLCGLSMALSGLSYLGLQWCVQRRPSSPPDAGEMV